MKDTRSLEALLGMYEANNSNEKCWETGVYSGDCDCSTCDHSHECSGSNTDDE